MVAACAAVPTAACAQAVAAQHADLRPTVHGFRISQHRNLTRLVLTLDGPIRFRAFTVDGPYRLVVDMEPVTWKLATAFRVSSSMLTSFSFAGADTSTDSPIARLTAVMRRPARVQKSFALRPKGKARDWRLVVDLEPVSADEFDRLKRSGRSGQADGATTAVISGAAASAARLHLAAARSDRRWTIVLDPGHGGVDKGASSPWGLQEKFVVLSTAQLVRRYLRRDPRFRVLLTRNDDRYIPLQDRYEFARKHRASLFVSIHADANPVPAMRGLSVHTLSTRASDKMTERLAERENGSDAIAGVDLRGASKSVSSILMDLVRRETRVGSARISALIVRSARRRVRLLRRPRRSARFVVLKAPDVPSVLVELGFLTNRKDEKLLRTVEYRRKLAAVLARAIVRYFNRRTPARRGRQSARAED